MRINTGPPVEGDDFFGRKKELKKLADTLSNKNASVFIPGPRRIGKTSLVKEFIRINKEKHQFVFFDLMGRNSIVDFCTDLNKEMASSFPDKLKSKPGFKQIWNSISEMIPEFKIHTIIDVKTGKLATPLKDLMDKMEKLFKELKDENVIISFDEFSDFLFKLKNRSNDELTLFLEWLRRIRQQHTVQFIITGSINILSTAEELGMLDLINDMTDLDILPLVDQEIQDLLKVLLADKNVRLTGEAMNFAITILQNGIPFYVQLFADGIDQYNEGKRTIDLKIIEKIYTKITDKRHKEFMQLHALLKEYLSPNDMKTAHKILAHLTTGCMQFEDLYPYLSDTESDTEKVNRILKRLVDECYIQQQKGSYGFVSPMLADWWKNSYGYERK